MMGNETAADAAKPLLAGERRGRIALLLAQQGSVRVSDLSALFGVSEVTVRGDLDAMDRDGRLLRDRGGAISIVTPNLITAFEQRETVNLDDKRRIGSAAAKLITANDTVILDAGTTVMELARSLKDAGPITIVTNALNVATYVGLLPGVQVILAGGALNLDTISTFGPQAERALSEVRVQKVFLGARAMDLDTGVSDVSFEIAQVKQMMIRAARQVILLADSSKWGHVAFARVIALSAVHTIISDDRLPADARAAIDRLGIRLILA